MAVEHDLRAEHFGGCPDILIVTCPQRGSMMGNE